MAIYTAQIREFIARHTTVSSEEKVVLMGLGNEIQESHKRMAEIKCAISAEKKRRVQETQTMEANLRRAAIDKMLKQREEIKSVHKERMDNMDHEHHDLQFTLIPRLRADLEQQINNGEPSKPIKLTESRLYLAEARRASIKVSMDDAEAADTHDAGDFYNVISFWAADLKRERYGFDKEIKRLRKKHRMLVSHIIRLEVRIEMKMACHTRRRSF